jgi:hypothetical protein
MHLLLTPNSVTAPASSPPSSPPMAQLQIKAQWFLPARANQPTKYAKKLAA